MDGYDLQCTEIITLKGAHVQLTLYLVTKEAEVRVVHVARWVGWINTGETFVEFKSHTR